MNFSHFPRRFLTFFVLLFLFGTGCAYKRMIFNNLDWLVGYQLDSYLDLTAAQEKSIKMPVEQTIDWLKAERLPAIVQLLREVETAADARRVDAQTFEGWVRRVEGLRTEVTDRVTPPLALLLKQLNEGQIEHLEDKLSKGDRKLVKLLERSDSEFSSELDDYVDEAAGSYKFWFGKLRKDQKALFVQKLGWNRTTLTEQLKQRRRSREFWISILRRHDRELIVTTLQQSVQPEGAFRDPEYQRHRKEMRERSQSFMMALFASLDQEQWQHLSKVVRELVGDMENLSAAQRSRT